MSLDCTGLEEYDDIQQIESYIKLPLGKAEDLRKYKKFEHLTPIYRTISRCKNTCWLVQCDCENQTLLVVRACDLKKKNHTTSCGCIQKKIAKQNGEKSKQNLIGQRFGYLEVTKEAKERLSGRVTWECYCHNCHSGGHRVTGHNLTLGITNSCGCITSKGEEKIQQILSAYQIQFERQKQFETCKNQTQTHYLRFDFYIPQQNCLIEYDGKQHFEQGAGWGNKLEDIQARDKIKNQWCRENNIPLIRIPYTHYDDLCLEDLLIKTTSFLLK